MTDKTSALILEHLRVLRLEMGELRADVRDMRGRLTSLKSPWRTCMATLPANPSESTASKAVWSGSSTDCGCATREAAAAILD
ncbi:MAG TPA: hypothetical protein VFF19_08165 [Reyranella sp.]|nr:hypothetical protein [Reyranella sp.]